MRYILFILLLCTVSVSWAQKKEEVFSIDTWCEDCIGSPEGQTTLGSMDCLAKAREKWDAELNKYYKQLMDTLKPARQEQLRTAQRQWLKYRDTEFEFCSYMHHDMEGSLFKVHDARHLTDIVRTRALELRYYYRTYTYETIK